MASGQYLETIFALGAPLDKARASGMELLPADNSNAWGFPQLRTGISQLLPGFIALLMVFPLVSCSGSESSRSTPDIPATVALAVREALPMPEPTPNIAATVAVAVQEALPTPGPTPNIAATVAVAVEETLTASTPTRDPTPTVTVANPGIFSSATPHILPPPTPHILPSATPEIAVRIPKTGEVIRLYSAPPQVLRNSDVTGVRYLAEFQTNLGNFTVELFPLDAPVTVDNFLFLANAGFYDGVTFHRVIPSFIIQSGDPTKTGAGGPGYKFQDEISPSLNFDEPGVLAMANAGPDTNGSQFFVTVTPSRHLTGNHTIFGQVIEGQYVVDAISLVPTDGGGRPLDDVEISKILLTESREEK